jgi:hypothetical protein
MPPIYSNNSNLSLSSKLNSIWNYSQPNNPHSKYFIYKIKRNKNVRIIAAYLNFYRDYIIIEVLDCKSINYFIMLYCNPAYHM